MLRYLLPLILLPKRSQHLPRVIYETIKPINLQDNLQIKYFQGNVYQKLEDMDTIISSGDNNILSPSDNSNISFPSQRILEEIDDQDDENENEDGD